MLTQAVTKTRGLCPYCREFHDLIESKADKSCAPTHTGLSTEEVAALNAKRKPEREKGYSRL